VLDEAQAHPAVFPRLRGLIDARRRQHGRFLILGSVAPSLMVQVSESLAGRLALVELTPFTVEEVGPAKLDRLFRFGGFPDGGILRASAYPTWQESYVALLTQRDLPSWGLSAPPRITERLLRMVAAAHGGILNATQLGQSLGVSYHTVQSYLRYLEGAYLVRTLPPFEANLRKRLVKSPRLYLRDTGVLHALLGLGPKEDLAAKPWVGASWEGFVVEQILATRAARGEKVQPFFFRTHDGLEVDLVLASGGALELVEIKLTTAPSPDDAARLRQVGELLGARRTVLLTRTRDPLRTKDHWSVDLPTYLAHA
jgi:predicted AAA+ superfamily ATPase